MGNRAPIRDTRPLDLLERAPTELAELPAFFARLDAEQLRAVAVGAIVDCAERAGFPDLGNLARALTAWRDHEQLRAERTPSVYQIAKRAQDRQREDRLVALALAAAPSVGASFRLMDVYPIPRDRVLAARALKARSEFDVYRIRQPGRAGAPFWARRVA